MLRPRTLVRLCWAGTSIGFAGVVLVVLLTAATPYDGVCVDRAETAPATKTESRTPASEPTITREQLESVAALNLRRPLVDPPPPTPIAVPITALPAAPTVAATLGGTIIEPGHSYAVLTDSTGVTAVKTVGEMEGAARIIRIETTSVTFEVDGQTVVLNKVPDTADSSTQVVSQ